MDMRLFAQDVSPIPSIRLKPSGFTVVSAPSLARNALNSFNSGHVLNTPIENIPVALAAAWNAAFAIAPLPDVLLNQIFKKFGFASPGRAADIKMCLAVFRGHRQRMALPDNIAEFQTVSKNAPHNGASVAKNRLAV
jgi:hypothetical protein